MKKARLRPDNHAALAYWPAGNTVSRVALDATGLPTDLSVVPTTPHIVEKGYGVIAPQYRGTFDSAGTFSPEQSIATLLYWQSLLQRHAPFYNIRNDEWISFPNRFDVVIGHSYGSYTAMGAILRGLIVRSAIIFAPMFHFGPRVADVGLKVDFDQHVRHIAEALPLTFRMDSPERWRHFFLNQHRFHPEPSAAICPERVKLLAVVGDKDYSLDTESNERYVRTFCDEYTSCIELVDFIVVPGGTHDIESLLSTRVLKAISALL